MRRYWPALALIAACSYRLDVAPCKISCSSSGECPDDLQCVAGLCQAGSSNSCGARGGDASGTGGRAGSGDAGGAAAAAAFRVNSFTKSPPGGGPAVSQTIAHGLGVVPAALILWTAGKAGSGGADVTFALGVSDGPESSYSIGGILRNGQGDAFFPGAGPWRRSAPAALSVPVDISIVGAEARLDGWDAETFTVTWTTNATTPCLVHFIALGGPGVLAKVLLWKTSAASGAQAVTGVGFSPSAVLHLSLGQISVPPPTFQGGLYMGLAAMTGPGGQWGYQLGRTGATPMGQLPPSSRSQKPGALMIAGRDAAFRSMDADGFTVELASPGNEAYVVSLALGGVSAQAGSFSKSVTVPSASQRITGVGFQPGVVLLASGQDLARQGPVPHARLGLGASDGRSGESAALNITSDLTPSRANGLDRKGSAFVKMDNDVLRVEAAAGTASFESDGFALDWVSNDAAATEILYLALGSKR